MLPLIKAELLQPCAFGFVIRTRNLRRLRLCVEFSKVNNFHCGFAVVKETIVAAANQLCLNWSESNSMRGCANNCNMHTKKETVHSVAPAVTKKKYLEAHHKFLTF